METLHSPTAAASAPRLPAMLAGLALAVAGPVLWLALRPSSRSLLFWLCWGSLFAGVTWVLLAAFLRRQSVLLKSMHWLTVNAFVFVIMLAVLEAGFRAAGFNFNALTGESDDPHAQYPLCFRMPQKPLGQVFFHREGPVEWTGKPLSEYLKLRYATDKAYENEASFTSRYDADGFRNPEGMKSWQAVVVGDSFTESGMLPVEQIFTSVAEQQSGLSIRNLGVCNTGTLSHLEYLRQFAANDSARHAVLAFYDGNDILDTTEEAESLTAFQKTGKRPLREPQPQTSLIKAGYQVAKHFMSPSPYRSYQDAWLTAGGKETPISIRPAPVPLDPETMTADQKQRLEDNLGEWATTCVKLKLKPWLLYLPANNRTYHGLVRYKDDADPVLKRWQPGSLPEHVQNLCDKHGIRFVNACPELRKAAEKGTLVYNPILDTHLNATGSRIIGELLAKHLADAKADGETMSRP